MFSVYNTERVLTTCKEKEKLPNGKNTSRIWIGNSQKSKFPILSIKTYHFTKADWQNLKISINLLWTVKEMAYSFLLEL